MPLNVYFLHHRQRLLPRNKLCAGRELVDDYPQRPEDHFSFHECEPTTTFDSDRLRACQMESGNLSESLICFAATSATAQYYTIQNYYIKAYDAETNVSVVRPAHRIHPMRLTAVWSLETS